MQLGKTLLGAVIGAALGVGLLVAANLSLGIDKVWLAVAVAVLTGMGVRLMVSTSGHASYLRGAITGVLALAAYLGGQYVVKEVATRAANQQQLPPVAAVERPADADATDEAAEEPADAAAPQPPAIAGSTNKAASQRDPAPQFSTLDFIWLCVAALVAYELGRGTGTPARSSPVSGAPESPPAS